MVELVDIRASKARAFGREGSNPSASTNTQGGRVMKFIGWKAWLALALTGVVMLPFLIVGGILVLLVLFVAAIVDVVTGPA